MSVLSALRSSKLIIWKPTGKLQQTLAGSVERKGISLHSGKVSTVRLCPGLAGQGRYFDFRSKLVPASLEFAQVSTLCTTLCKDGVRIRTVEHLLSALEAAGVDNCRIEVENSDDRGEEAEIPIFDGLAREWMEALEEVGLETATDIDGKSCVKIAPHVNEPVHVWRNDSFIAAFTSEVVRVTYGINFPQVEQMRNAGLIKGVFLENAIVCRKQQRVGGGRISLLLLTILHRLRMKVSKQKFL